MTLAFATARRQGKPKRNNGYTTFIMVYRGDACAENLCAPGRGNANDLHGAYVGASGFGIYRRGATLKHSRTY